MATRMYSATEIGVFWDLEYCPIPDGLTPALVSQNIKAALKNMGYTGEVSIKAYSLTKPKNEEDFESAGITLCYFDWDLTKRIIKLMEAIHWVDDDKLSNLMLISEDISEDSDYIDALIKIRDRDHNVLLAQPQAAVGLLETIPSAIWLWSSLSAGGSPVDNQSGSLQVLTPCLADKKKKKKKKKKNKKKKKLADEKKKKPLAVKKKKMKN